MPRAVRMRTEAFALLLVALAPVAFAAGRIESGEKRICVPSEDGRGWECGTPDAPPPERGLPARSESSSSPAPPPFLMDPRRAAAIELGLPLDAAQDPSLPPEPVAAKPVAEAQADEAVSPPSEPAPEPVAQTVAPQPVPVEEATSEVVAEALPEPEPAAVPAPAVEEVAPASETPAMLAAPESTDDPFAPPVEQPVGTTEPVTEDVPAEPAVASEPEPAAEVATEPVPAPEPAPPEPEPEPEPAPAEPVVVAPPVASAVVHAAPPLDARAFLALGAARHTVQLARARSPASFAPLLARLGLAPETAYAIPIAADGVNWWLLLWGDHPDAASAREAAAAIPRDAEVASAWPRRIAPLQDELRRAGLGAR